MPSPASISISASPEIARFGGMVFHVFNDDHIEPHVEVMVKGTKFRWSLLDGTPLGKPKAPAKVSKRVQGWLKAKIPGGTRTVNDLVYDQWLKVRNRQPAEHVPTPDEIKVLARPKKTPQKSSHPNSHSRHQAYSGPASVPPEGLVQKRGCQGRRRESDARSPRDIRLGMGGFRKSKIQSLRCRLAGCISFRPKHYRN